jgi:hypothetical protein
LLDLAEKGRSCEGIPDCGLIARVYGSFSYVELSAIEWNARNGGTVLGVDGLVVDGLVVCIAVELGVEG